MVNPRSIAVILMVTSATFLLADVAGAQSKSKGKGKPQQVVPTGAEDSPLAPADPAGEARLEEMTSRSSEGLVEVEHADGSKSIDLQGRFMSVMVAADGGKTASCHTSHEAVKQAQAMASKPVAGAKGKQSRRIATPTPVAPTTFAPRELQ